MLEQLLSAKRTAVVVCCSNLRLLDDAVSAEYMATLEFDGYVPGKGVVSMLRW